MNPRERGAVRPSRSRGSPGAHGGYTFIELLFATALVAILAGIAVPHGGVAIDRHRASAAARFISARAGLARAEAVKRSAYVALRFERRASGIVFGTVVDGNRNGVRTTDIASRQDWLLDAPVSLADMFPGVAIALGDSPAASNSVTFGPSGLLSFSPIGTATSGTVYVRGRDGSQFAVRVLGATGRTRVLRYVPRTGQWTATS